MPKLLQTRPLGRTTDGDILKSDFSCLNPCHLVICKADRKYQCDVWVFLVQLIFGPRWPMNQLKKKPKHCLTWLPISSGHLLRYPTTTLPLSPLVFSAPHRDAPGRERRGQWGQPSQSQVRISSARLIGGYITLPAKLYGATLKGMYVFKFSVIVQPVAWPA